MIKTLDPSEYSKLIDLAESVTLGEKIDFKCTFIVKEDESGKILGAAGTRFDFISPRFEHIIVREEYQKTSLAGRLMLETEKLVRSEGHTAYVALIPQTNEIMTMYAIKFGFKEYDKGKSGMWFYKQL